MAIFYNKIKGYSANITGSGDKDLWSILKWGVVPEGLITTAIENFRIDFIPSLEVHGSSNEDKAKYNFGHFLVTGPTPEDGNKYDKGQSYYGQYIYTDLCFGAKDTTLHVDKMQGLDNNKTLHINDFVHITDTTLTIKEGSQAHEANFVMIDQGETEFYKISTSSNNASLTSKIQNLTFENIESCSFTPASTGASAYPFNFEGSVNVNAEIKARDKIEALYFNATSDSRAKTILGKAPSALDTVLDTPIYEYFYKDDAKKTELIGILAQDLLKKHDVFHIVNNQSATGVNGDFMTIKEDRLVFILWKALQELEEEVQELRNEVKKLRGGE